MPEMSMVAFFHKHYRGNTQTRRRLAASRKKSKPKVDPNWQKCDKCEELHKVGNLLHDKISGLTFCSDCMNAVNILRDTY